MNFTTTDEDAVGTLMATVQLITTALDANPEDWRNHLQAIRNVTAVLEFTDTRPNETRRVWQTTLITTFQRVAYADADAGGVLDISDWCLKQAVTLLSLYPENVELLMLIGQNWLSRAQKSLARIHLSEQSSSSSGGSPLMFLSTSEENRQARRSDAEAESRLYTADYVEARGTLLPAVEYLERAVEAARTQEKLTGGLLSVAAEAFMSLGNVSSLKTNGRYLSKALSFLHTATELPGYVLPHHLRNYLEDYGNLAENFA